MDGFDKIELKPNKINSADSENPKKKKLLNGRLRIMRDRRFIFGLGIFLLVLFIGIVVPGFLTFISAKKTYTQATVTLKALKHQDIDLASKELVKSREDLKDTQRNLRFMVLLRFIPFANTYYNDADHMVKAGFYALDAGEITLNAIKPYADVLGLKGQGSFVTGSAQDRIETAVKTMGKITPKIDDIAKDLALVKQEVDYVDPNDYPAFLLGGKINNAVKTLRSTTDDGVEFITEAKPLIKVLPQLAGEPDPKKYLILFQNDKELRPTGGFITSYAIFNLQHGIIHVDENADIYSLDATLGNKAPAPEPLKKYLEVSSFNLRDANISPDFGVSMKTFSSMYQKAGGYKKVDGIAALDTSALVAAMNVLGDIQVGGTTYSTKEDPRCKCPQVIYALEQYADQPVEYYKSDRKGLIGDLMYAIMNKAFSSSPKLYWGPLFQAMLSQVFEKHIMFYLYDKNAQAGIDALNAGGKITSFKGDYFHLNEANLGGAKSNLYVEQTVKEEYQIKNDGTIEKTVTVDYKNPFPPSDCNLEHGNLCLNATLRDWFRIYVPKGSELLSMKGSQVKQKTYDELGKTVFEGFLEVRPLGTKELTFSYRLPFKLAKGSPLPVLYQKQPGTKDVPYSVFVNGKETKNIVLNSDQKFTLEP